ncbi:MAG: hypothetical protein A2051_03825 [Desulfovibrionales bacterium GWA2_65_9]|nr:MAG: hypothetical protein A2051_03825 [Desulfovibrionales bacterium GWA2_65_9]
MRDLEQLVNELSGEAAPTRPAPHPYLLGLQWTLMAAAYLAVALAFSGLRPDLSQALQQPGYVAELLTLLLLFAASTTSAALLAFPDLHQKRLLAYAPVGAFALLALTLLAGSFADTAPLPEHSIECTIDISLVSLLPAVAIFLLMRGYASTHPRWAGSVALLAAFSTGALWLRLYETNDSVVHVVLWHYLPMLLAGFIGWMLGRRLLKW